MCFYCLEPLALIADQTFEHLTAAWMFSVVIVIKHKHRFLRGPILLDLEI